MPVREPDKQYLTTIQYRNASNLNARASLHARYGVSESPWFQWLFDHIARVAQAHANVLEVGAGPGVLWREILTRVPEGWSVTLTDLSDGMIREERKMITHPAFAFVQADAESLPFADDTFDVVIANHMLYHVPDRPKALSEFRRVLRPGGVLIAATNGENNMRELTDLIRAVAKDEDSTAWLGVVFHTFTLENGASQLASYFSDIAIQHYPDALEVTDVEPLVAYVLSMDIPGFDESEVMSRLEQQIRREMDQAGGVFHISKEVGAFIARNSK